MESKPIALICNYYILNYGSILQSYALYEAVKREGVNVDVIQYEDRATGIQKFKILLHEKSKRLFSDDLIRKVQRKKAEQKDTNYTLEITERKKLFSEFYNSRFQFSNKYNDITEIVADSEKYSFFLLGSDQLWGPQDLIRGYHTLEWLPEDKKRGAYATSFGVSQLPSYAEKIVSQFIPHFSGISTREKSGADIIQRITGKKAEVVLDPTLLLSKVEWEERIPEEDLVDGKYIFSYMLGENLEYRKKIQTFARKINCKIVAIADPEFYELSDEKYADI